MKPIFAKGSCSVIVAKGTGAADAIQVEKRKQTIRLKNGQRNWMDISLKKTYR